MIANIRQKITYNNTTYDITLNNIMVKKNIRLLYIKICLQGRLVDTHYTEFLDMRDNLY